MATSPSERSAELAERDRLAEWAGLPSEHPSVGRYQAEIHVQRAYRDAARRGVKIPAQSPEVRLAKSRLRYWDRRAS